MKSAFGDLEQTHKPEILRVVVDLVFDPVVNNRIFAFKILITIYAQSQDSDLRKQMEGVFAKIREKGDEALVGLVQKCQSLSPFQLAKIINNEFTLLF